MPQWEFVAGAHDRRRLREDTLASRPLCLGASGLVRFPPLMPACGHRHYVA